MPEQALLWDGEEDRAGPGVAGTLAGDEDTGRSAKRAVSPQQVSFRDQPSISVQFNSIPFNSVPIYEVPSLHQALFQDPGVQR